MDTLSRFLRRSSRNRRAMALGNNNASVERVLQEASLLQTASSAAPPLPARPPATQPSRIRTSALRRRATFRTEDGNQRLTLRDRRRFLRTLESDNSKSNLRATKSHLSSSGEFKTVDKNKSIKKKLLTLILLKMAERSEAKSA